MNDRQSQVMVFFGGLLFIVVAAYGIAFLSSRLWGPSLESQPDVSDSLPF